MTPGAGLQPGDEVLFHGGWADYEEAQYLSVVRCADGSLWTVREGHCVMVEDNSPSVEQVTDDEALAAMLEFEADLGVTDWEPFWNTVVNLPD